MYHTPLTKPTALLFTGLCLLSCGGNKSDFDAMGTFEADEVIVSAEAAGKILAFDVEEGKTLTAGQQVGAIDSTQLRFTFIQLQENQKAVRAGMPDVQTQINATKKEIENGQSEKRRVENLVKGQVANQKQLDDVNLKIAVLEARLAAQQNSLNSTGTTLREQASAIDAQLAMVKDQLKKCRIVNPVNGTVLARYAMANEMTAPGKPLYKTADLSSVILRAYVSGNQMAGLKLGQTVNINVDAASGGYKTYQGTLAWISEKAEFTPKTIQTKEERENLVYAVKINVKNDGYLKLGMYGEVKLSSETASK
jgi:HlyD family secretion protein